MQGLLTFFVSPGFQQRSFPFPKCDRIPLVLSTEKSTAVFYVSATVRTVSEAFCFGLSVCPWVCLCLRDLIRKDFTKFKISVQLDTKMNWSHFMVKFKFTFNLNFSSEWNFPRYMPQFPPGESPWLRTHDMV